MAPDDAAALPSGAAAAASSATAEEQQPHHGFICDACDANPIVGRRFKCLDCADYDLCGACYVKGSSDSALRHFMEVLVVADDAVVATPPEGETNPTTASSSASAPPLRPRRKRRGSPSKQATRTDAPAGKRRKGDDGAPNAHPLVCGPEWVQTLRGRLLGREVALICCGEAHQETIDLTRPGAILEPRFGWVPLADFPSGDADHTRRGLGSVAEAQAWAEHRLTGLDEADEDVAGAVLVFEEAATGETVARFFTADRSSFSSSSSTDESRSLLATASAWEWADVDAEARALNRRRLAGEDVPAAEEETLIAERKRARLDEGIELFDDWLVRQATGASAHVEVVLEAPVPASEVELHVEPGLGPAPAAAECLRAIELDSEDESEADDDPDDGCCAFIAYLHRRLTATLRQGSVRCIDPRELGDPHDDEARRSFEALAGPHPAADAEADELDRLGAMWVVPVPPRTKHCGPHVVSRGRDSNGYLHSWRRGKADPVEEHDRHKHAQPSWEAFFGAAAELLYYSPHVKADYTPFLAACFGEVAVLMHFFAALYFGTVPEALRELRLGEEQRPFARLRSLAYCPPPGATPPPQQAVFRRPGERLVPVRAAPVDRYLKARGSEPPRTWVSGLAGRLRQAGEDGDGVVEAARAWYMASVERLLADPKAMDLGGDYFQAYLRECHPDIHGDVDTSDTQILRDARWAPGEAKGRRQYYDLGAIGMPGLGPAFAEVAAFSPAADRASSRRQRVLSKILVDAFQLRLVDVAAILAVADCIASAPAGANVVVVLYAGGEHAKSVEEFWRAHGFSDDSLAQHGRVGKGTWAEDEPRGLCLPSYLHDLDQLFGGRG